MKIAILGTTLGWHAEQLHRALETRGHTCSLLPIVDMVAKIGLRPQLSCNTANLDEFDFVLVRFIPRGSLEQIIFKMDALHLLEARGARVINSAKTIEQTVDKLYTSGLLAQNGLPTPRTIVCENSTKAMQAFSALGGDVIVKPLFGAMGRGLVRVEDKELAYRVFKALDLERAVYYLQETIHHTGCDIRAFVVGGQVIAAIERFADGWCTNVARGAQVRAVQLSTRQTELCLQAATMINADYAGVDLLPSTDGKQYLLEVNSIPAWQGLQSTCTINIAEEIVTYLETQFSRHGS